MKSFLLKLWLIEVKLSETKKREVNGNLKVKKTKINS